MANSPALTAEQQATMDRIAADQRSPFQGKPSRDVRWNFPLLHKIKGDQSYRNKLTDAAKALYALIQKDELVRSNFNKPVHLNDMDRAKLNVLPDHPKFAHRFALEMLVHSMAYALSRPMTKDKDGRETRRNFVAIPLNNKDFSKPPFNILNRDAFRSMVYALAIYDPEKRGKPWLEYVPPKNFPGPGNAKRTCVMADVPLREWMFTRGLIFPYHPVGPSSRKSNSAKKARKSPLWVSYKGETKDAETEYVPLDRPLHSEEEILPAINAALGRQKLVCKYDSYAEYDKYYDYREGRPKTALGGNKRLYRQFAEEDGRGGRLYGHWVQTMPSELRQRLTINGKPTRELDFGNMQLVLLYDLAGTKLALDVDLYALPGMTASREDMKMVLTLSVGNPTRQRTEAAIRKKLREAGRIKPGRAEQLYDEFWSHHEVANPHRRVGGEDPWVALQSLDSRIALRILARLFGQRITAIPVHDSFIVERCHAETTESVMKEVFAEYCPGTFVQVKWTPPKDDT